MTAAPQQPRDTRKDYPNAGDPVLASVPEDRRGTLIAKPVPGGYRLDIRLQGEGEPRLRPGVSG